MTSAAASGSAGGRCGRITVHPGSPPTSPDVVVVARCGGDRRRADAPWRKVVRRGSGGPGSGCGRAWTVSVRGHPVDLGAHWLHAGPINPLVALGHARGERLRRAPQDGHTWVSGRPALPREARASGNAFAQARPGHDRLRGTGRRGSPRRQRVAGRARPLAQARRTGARPRFGAGAGGDLPRRLSEHGIRRQLLHRRGLRQLPRAARAGLPIRLGAAIRRIDWAGEGVRIGTEDGGTLAARAAIVTLPMMVLREGPAFSPPLPNAVRAAIDGFKTGIYEHAVLHWPSSPFSGRDRLAAFHGRRRAPAGLLTRIDDTPFHFYELDVVEAAEIDAAGGGEDAVRRRVRDVLAEQVGRARLRDLTIPAVSAWRARSLCSRLLGRRPAWARGGPAHPARRDRRQDLVRRRSPVAGTMGHGRRRLRAGVRAAQPRGRRSAPSSQTHSLRSGE